MHPVAALSACLLALAVVPVARAVDGPETRMPGDPPMLIASAGTFALVEQYDYPYLLGLQYRGRSRTGWKLRPGAGFDAGPDGMMYAYFDVARDFELPRQWLLTLSLGGGPFANGAPIGAGYDVQFKSGLVVARRLAGGGRVGLAGYHISNAGLDRLNNGSEALALFVALPLSR